MHTQVATQIHLPSATPPPPHTHTHLHLKSLARADKLEIFRAAYGVHRLVDLGVPL